MPELTRRRSTDAREARWHVYYGDVHVGTISNERGRQLRRLASFLANDILDCVVEAFDEVVDPLIFFQDIL
jgi:hypothetical protein